MTRPTKVSISISALRHNLKVVQKLSPNSQIIAMVKANAYGCGIESVVSALKNKVFGFGVACIEEALAVRSVDSDSPCILFQGVFSKDEWRILRDNKLTAVIHSEKQLEQLLDMQTDAPMLPVWIKVDTGMHRLGFYPDEIQAVYASLLAKGLQCEGLMSHMACADTPEHPLNNRQLQCFNTLEQKFPGFKHSLANSATIMTMPDAQKDLVRPGIMLYGVSPFADKTGKELGLKPVMQFFSEITAIHHYDAGETIGYGAIWSCNRASKIAVLTVGYGDGYPRTLHSPAFVCINGGYYPVVGRLSMDMMTVDVTDGLDVRVGDTAELWGEHVPVEQVACAADTIGYELITRITFRVGRT